LKLIGYFQAYLLDYIYIFIQNLHTQ